MSRAAPAGAMVGVRPEGETIMKRSTGARGGAAGRLSAVTVLLLAVGIGPGAGDPQAGAPQGSAGRQGQTGGRGQGAPPAQPNPDGPVRGPSGAVIGFTNLAEIPGTPWRIHDASRPQPPVITPGDSVGAPPSDATVLFGGTDLSQWESLEKGQPVAAKWPVHDGYFETGAGSGSIRTRERFGSIQLHLEFATPANAEGDSQARGNSGVILMGRYEVQVLDSYDNRTYADGMAASIYGEYPPLVNAARRPGEWQTYDIVFEAPRFDGATVVAPAYVTVFWNGALAQLRRAVMGPTSPTRTVHQYTPHEPELPLTLQDHANPVRYRNVWVRRLPDPRP
jgi:3-keto-disaccharide hydrolase